MGGLMSDSFEFDSFLGGFSSHLGSTMDSHIHEAEDVRMQGREQDGKYYNSVRTLTEQSRTKNAVAEDIESGTRVAFIANLGSLLTYDDPPGDGMEGTVVTVRTAHGTTTTHESRVFVLWDDGKFRPTERDHVRSAKSNKRVAKSVRIRVADLGDISTLFASTTDGQDLIHKATQDLWSLKQDTGGNYVIERLFNDTGQPLKM